MRTRAILDALLEFSDVDFFWMAYYRHEEIEDRLDAIQGSNAFLQSDRCKLVGWLPHYKRKAESRFAKITSACMSLLPTAFWCSIEGAGYRVDTEAQRRLQTIVAHGKYDALVVRYLNTFIESGILQSVAAGLPVYLDADDWESNKMQSRKSADPALQNEGYLRSFLRSRRLMHLKCVERRAIASSRRVFVSSECDEHISKGGMLTVLPNIPIQPNGEAIESLGKSDPRSKEILIVSQIDYPPNRDGIRWFLQECWPVIIHDVPEARLTLVGAASSETLNEIASNLNVHAVGRVDDLSPSYRQCAFTIAPVQWGGGTSIKVLESLAYGRVTVVSPFVARRMGQRMQEFGCLAAKDTEDYRRLCVRLLTDVEYRHHLETRCADLKNSEVSVSAFRQMLERSMVKRSPNA